MASTEGEFDELRARREDILREFDAADAPDSAFTLQERIAAEIIAAEPVAYSDRESPERMHIEKLRIIVDGLAWRFLHSYTIRQLSKSGTPPPSLSNQGAGFRATMEVAQDFSEAAPVVIADLTNCICCGDVVVCADSERPTIIEVGGHPRFTHRGRKGRQMARNVAIVELLEHGYGTLPGSDAVVLTIPIDVEPAHTFPAVAEAVGAAVQGEVGVAIASADDVIWANPGAGFDDLPALVLDACEPFKRSVAMGAHMRLIEDPNLGVLPFVGWPIPLEQRVALLEEDVVLAHFVNLDAFLDPADRSPPRITGHRSTRNGALRAFIAIDNDGAEGELTAAFANSAIYGFETIESVRDSMRALIAKAPQAANDVPDLETRPDGVALIDSVDDLMALRDDVDRSARVGRIHLSQEAVQELEKLAAEHGIETPPARALIVPRRSDGSQS